MLLHIEAKNSEIVSFAIGDAFRIFREIISQNLTLQCFALFLHAVQIFTESYVEAFFEGEQRMRGLVM